VKKDTGKARPISHEIDGGGWVNLWRKILYNEVFASADLLRMFVWCLLSASHTTHHVPAKTGRGGTVATIGRGQFMYGRNSAADKLGLAPSTVDRRMKRLERMKAITIQPDSHFSIVTVCNWDRYQGTAGEIEHPTGHPRNTQGTPNEQARNRERTHTRMERRERRVRTPRRVRKAGRGETTVDMLLGRK
jgi:hypothetical protein